MVCAIRPRAFAFRLTGEISCQVPTTKAFRFNKQSKQPFCDKADSIGAVWIGIQNHKLNYTE